MIITLTKIVIVILDLCVLIYGVFFWTVFELSR